jgi:transposase
VSPRFAGVTATSSMIEVAVRPGGEIWKTDSADESITATAAKLQGIQPELVVLEGTGTYELPLAGLFATVGLPFAIVNPRSLREFARAVGRMSRLDSSQAGLLAHFGELVHPETQPLSNDVVEKLKDLRARRTEILQMLQLERGRLAEASAVLRKDLQRHVTFLEQNIAALDLESNRIIRVSTAWTVKHTGRTFRGFA